MAASDLFSGTNFQPSTLVELLRWRAAHQRDRECYNFLTDADLDATESVAQGMRLTFGELDRRARAIGAWLQSVGARRERVLLLYPSGPDYLYGFFGCQYADATAVPLFPPQTVQGMSNLQNIVKDAEAKVILTTASFHALLAPLLASAPELQELRWLHTDTVAQGLEDEWREPEPEREHLALLQYTSGTTGLPKGVMLTHGNVFENCEMIAEVYERTPETCALTWIPTYHNSGLFGGLIHPLYGDFTSVLMSPLSFLQSPPRWLRAIGRYRATVTGGPNFAYDLCVRYATPELLSTLDLSTWERAFTGAEHIHMESLNRFAETFAACGFRPDAFFTAYGLTESCLMVSGRRPSTPFLLKRLLAAGLENNRVIEAAPDEEHARVMVSCGQILPYQKAVIVDPETSTRCEPGRIGELWLASGSVAQGYWQRRSETDATFGAQEAQTGEGPFLRTGDLGFIEDEHLFITGRLKDLIIIRGHNHYPQDIEASVAQAHPSLSLECAVFSVVIGTEESLVVVQEIPETASEDDYDAMLEAMRQAIAREHGIQVHALLLVKQGTIPRTALGKIQRHACRAAYLNGSLPYLKAWRSDGGAEREAQTGRQVENPDSVEDVAAWMAVWVATRTGMDESAADPEQSIAGYGLDSLAAVELAHLIETVLGVSLPMWSLLQGQSIAELASQIVAQRAGEGSARQPITVNDGREVGDYPLSHGQKSLWFLYRMAPESPAYNVAGAVGIKGALDVAAMRRSFEILVERHPSLRTTFIEVEGVPLQRVHECLPFLFEEVDAAGWSEQSLKEQLAELAHLPFDLATGPLLRLWLFRRSPEDYILLSAAHHIVTDLWSSSVLLDEQRLIYIAETEGAAVSLPPVTLRYTDFALWQEAMLAGAEGERLWNYWQRQLSGDGHGLELPTDKPRPPVQTYRGALHAFKLDAELTRGLKALSQHHGVTLYMTLLAGFLALLHRYTGQLEINVGSPTAGRTRVELARLVGYLVNPLVLRAEFAHAQTFDALLRQVQQTMLDAFEHQDYPFSLLVERLHPERDPARSPLFQAMFVLQKAHQFEDEELAAFALGEAGAHVQISGLTLEAYPLEQRIAQFDLTLMMAEVGGGLSASFEYNTDLFEPATIERLSAHLRALLQAAVADPSREVGALPMLTDEERRRLLVEWSGREDAGSLSQSRRGEACVHRLFEAQAARTPEAVAVVAGPERVSYGELNARANQLAHHLRASGVGPETIVGVMLERSVEMLVGLCGVLKAGGAYLPLDPSYPHERLDFMLKDSGAACLLTRQGLDSALEQSPSQVVHLDTHWPAIARLSDANPEVDVHANNLAYIIYTSGSTGVPKGVMVGHASLANYIGAVADLFAITPEDRVLQFASFSFDVSAEEIFSGLTRGATLLLRDDEMTASPSSLLRACREHRITVVNLPTAYWHQLTASLRADEWSEADALRLVVIGSEKMQPERLSQWHACVGSRVRLVDVYGPTEATIGSTVCELTGLADGSDPARKVSIGRPIRHVQTYILDSNLEPVPAGVTGELHVGGLGLARGYLKRPALTAEKFIPDPFGVEPGARLYKTGDLARYLPDGNIEIRGRVDFQAKVRGFRIELGEIEVVLNSHRAVRECVVAAREDEHVGKRLVVYFVNDPRQPPATPAELRLFLQRELPDYMVPSAFVALDSLPLTKSGKVDRAALPAPSDLRAETGGAFVAPRTPVEEAMAGIWEQVLGLMQVGADDNFFALGGHSLLATQLISRARETFEVELPLRTVFESPTVALLSRVVEDTLKSRRGEIAPPVEPRPHGDDQALPLSFAQQRLWFLNQLQPHSYTYNMPGAVHLRGPLNLADLKRNLEILVGRHEALRTTFSMRDEEPTQIIHPSASVELPLLDLGAWPQESRAAEVRRLLIEEAERPFDLSAGPLLRLRLLRLGDEDHILQVTMHHIVSDGWSVAVFTRELTALAEASARGAEPALAPLPVQYADFARWQREWLRGEALESQFAYWKQQLKDSPAQLELPTDRPRPSVQTFRGASHSFALPATLTEDLKTLSRREGATLFMTLLAAFEVLLSRYTRQEDICVGTPVAGRTRREVEGLIGFFVNTLVLRSDLSGNPTFTQLLRRVRETTLSAYAYQDLPFEKLVEELHPERNLSHPPLFQVMFVMQSAPVPELRIPGLTLSAFEVPTTSAKFDLTLTMEESPEGLAAALEYNTDLFDPTTIERMCGHLRTLIEGIVEDPQRRLSSLPLLGAEERRRLLVEWNDTTESFDTPHCAHRLFEAQVERTPEAVAVVFEQQRLSYGELNRRANRLAHRLRSLGVGRDERVALVLGRGVEMVGALWAVLKAGAAYVPLDPEYPRELLNYMLADAGVHVVLTQQRLMRSLRLDEQTDVLCLDTDRESLERESDENPSQHVANEDLAYLIYTSGSTGRPKGVMVSHGGLSNYLNWALRAYGVADCGDAPVHSPLGFDLTVTSLYLPLLAGRTATLLPEAQAIEGLARDLSDASRNKLFKLTPAHLQMLSQLLPPESTTVRGEKVLVVGGEALSWQTLSFWMEQEASLRLINEYGPTETVVGCCTYEAGSRGSTRREGQSVLSHSGVHSSAPDVPIGRPIANTQLYILDEHAQPVPVGVHGELYIGGAGVARGYHNRPELTAEKFVPDPYGRRAGGRLYRTGDMARYLPGGDIEFLGRTDEQLKVLGFRIEAGEVEAALLRHASVREAVVVAREAASGDKRLVAYVVAETDAALSGEELRRHVGEQLPVHMVPSAVVQLKELPLTPNGKVNRKALPAPEFVWGEGQTERVAPRTETEKALAEVWRELLGVDHIGVADNFFALGGHSLLATRVVSRLRAVMRVELPLRTFFERPTIAELATEVEAMLWASAELEGSSVLGQGEREFGEL